MADEKSDKQHLEEVHGEQGGHTIDDLVLKHGHITDLEETELALVEMSPAEEKRILRKVDWLVVPQLTILYLMAFLDRSNSKLLPSIVLRAVQLLTLSSRKCKDCGND